MAVINRVVDIYSFKDELIQQSVTAVTDYFNGTLFGVAKGLYSDIYIALSGNKWRAVEAEDIKEIQNTGETDVDSI